MKKLLTLAAAIVAGSMANAATFKWTGANIYDHTGTTKYTGTAAIYAYLTTETLDKAVKVVDVGVTAGTIKDGSTTGYTYDWTSAVVGNGYNFYMVIEDGDYTFNSATSDPSVIKNGAAQATSTTTVQFANMATATQTAGNWAAVPEPTSGLLMLLGMAGLALKRKRA